MNLKNSKCTTALLNDSEKKTTSTLIDKIISKINEFIHIQTLSTYSQQHLYLMTTTLIINLPLVAESRKKDIEEIIDKLVSEEIIYEENMVLEYTSYKKFAQEFLTFDYETQNSWLYLDKRKT